MKKIPSFLLGLILCPLAVCFGSIHVVENPETESVIVFPTDDSFQQNEIEGGITYSSGGRQTGSLPCNYTVQARYKFTVNWAYQGLSDEEIFNHVIQELKEIDLKPYYIYSYGKSNQSEYSERLLAENLQNKIQVAIIVKSGIVYRIQTDEKLFYSWLDCTVTGVPGDHDGFLNSLRLKQ